MWAVLLAVGLYFTAGTRFWAFRRMGTLFRETFGRLGGPKTGAGITPFQAMSTALASTVGTGNIAGVATAIVAGGPGAVLWMWVSAFLSMMVKYAEVFLAVRWRKTDAAGRHYGGPMYYMERLGWKGPAAFFSLCGVLVALGMGNMTQVNTMADACLAAFGLPPLVTGLVTVGLVAVALFGGLGVVARVTERLVPFMALAYIALSVAVFILCRDRLGYALALIFSEAFRPGAMVGGVVGYGVRSAMRYGVNRGLFTNEAGLGSSPIAHAAADTDSAVRQGLWGAMEVFLDTIVICTMTALVILCTGVWSPDTTLDGAALTVRGFETALGPWGGAAVAVCTVLFVLATVLGWSYYGEQCCRYVFRREGAVRLYRVLYLAVIPVAALVRVDVIWQLADVSNSLMALPNLAALVLLSGPVFRELRRDPLTAPRRRRARRAQNPKNFVNSTPAYWF